MAPIDILIPTYNRAASLAVTLTALVGQTFRDFRIIISDQSDAYDVADQGEVRAIIRILEAQGHAVSLLKHLPRRGLAEHRQFLLDQASAPYVLLLDDDVILDPDMVERLHRAIREAECGFVGSCFIGLSFVDDVRPQQQAIEFWEGNRVQPERIMPGTPQWSRFHLHRAANIYHLQQRLNLAPDQQRLYKVAWVPGCVLFDTEKLRSVGGFSFWTQLPFYHSGEDVLAQVRVMARYGGCGVIPSGAYHQEVPSTIVVNEQHVDAPYVLPLFPETAGQA